MGWFDRLCQNAGLMIHHAVKPLKKSKPTVVKKEVEEKQVNETTILRRTTIEEIEIRNNDTPIKTSASSSAKQGEASNESPGE